MGKEDYILKKIRYFQGTVDDFETFWKKKIAESTTQDSMKSHNDNLNRAFEIRPVEND